jgi:hypothetical protein
MQDPINQPKHYTEHPSGIECIQITEHMGFNLGNAIKYIWRCDLKKDAIEDLKKAVWYIKREISKREDEFRKAPTEPMLDAVQIHAINRDFVNKAKTFVDINIEEIFIPGPGSARPHPRIENGEDPSDIITRLEIYIKKLEKKIVELGKELYEIRSKKND